MNLIKKSLFLFEENKKILALIDLGASKSGKILQNIDFVQPRIIKELQNFVKNNDLKIGDVVYIDRYVFFIVRKHYNTRFKEDLFKEIVGVFDTSKETYKTTLEVSKSMTPYLEYFLKHTKANVLVYKSSEWKDRSLGLEE